MHTSCFIPKMFGCIQLWRWCHTLKAATANSPGLLTMIRGRRRAQRSANWYDKSSPLCWRVVSPETWTWSVAAAAQPVEGSTRWALREALFTFTGTFLSVWLFLSDPWLQRGFFFPACCSLDVCGQKDGQPWHSSWTSQQMSTLETLAVGLQSIYDSMRQ